MGEGEGSGGGDGGARGALSPVGGSKGPEPLASPNVLHWVGWLPGTTRCGAGPAAPASQQEARLKTPPPLPGNATAWRVPIPDGEVPTQPPPLLQGCGSYSNGMSRDRPSQGSGSGQVIDYEDTYGQHRMPVDGMGRPWKHARPEDGCPRLNDRASALSESVGP